jgi:hypothetical protein
MRISELADQVRDIPLRDVLERYGFEPRREGTTLRARSEHHNIVVTGTHGSTTRRVSEEAERLTWLCISEAWIS